LIQRRVVNLLRILRDCCRRSLPGQCETDGLLLGQPDSSLGGFETTWKLACAMAVGLFCSLLGRVVQHGAQHTIRKRLGLGRGSQGQVLIGWLGRYGNRPENLLPNWVDSRRSDLAFALGSSLGRPSHH